MAGEWEPPAKEPLSWAQSRELQSQRRSKSCTTTTPTSSKSAGVYGNWRPAQASHPTNMDPFVGTPASTLAGCVSRGFGPLFADGAYESDGHIRVDFGTDTPFLEEDLELDSVAARHVEENVRQLVELTAAVEKASGATARLLWSELGESLAERLAARLSTRLSTRLGGTN